MFEPYKKLLTIGITAYNDEKYIAQTLDSCVNQAGQIIICDNGSTDGTSRICAEYAKKYSHIQYNKLEQDLGKCYGFNFVLKETMSKYFMWLGAHDYIDDNYTSPMIHMLENCDGAVGSYPASRSVTTDGQEIGVYDCWFANRLASDSALERIYTLIAHLHEVSAFYGIYQTKILKKFLPQQVFTNMVAGDHPLLCALAAEGRMLYSPRSVFNWRQTKMHLSDAENLADYQKNIFKNQDNSGFVPTRQNMCEWQLKILKECKVKKPGDFFKKIWLVCKAKKKLKKRFGY
ncbi:MAG: glycosyltransferase family 2 protein [Pseudomonadota bacterium]